MVATSDKVDALMAQIEERLRARVPQGLSVSHKVVQSLVGVGGKRVRPRMLVQLGHELGCDEERLIEYALAVEFVHTGTLLQDDVIDRSRTRRGHPTAWAMWGDAHGILGGSYLFMRTMSDLMAVGLNEGARRLAEAVQRLAEGEMLQQDIRWQADAKEEDIQSVAERKTGMLFSWICQMVAVEAGLDEDKASAWGRKLGRGFQLADDLLDFRDTESIGKTAKNDLREGMVTLPMRWAADKDATVATAIAHAFAERTEEAFEAAYDALEASPAISDAEVALSRLHQELIEDAGQWLADPASAIALAEMCLFRSI